MTKTLDELRQEWVDASAAYDRAVEANWESWKGRAYSALGISIAEMAAAERAMRVAWADYEVAFNAHLEAMDEAARLKPCESATTPGPPPPLPR